MLHTFFIYAPFINTPTLTHFHRLPPFFDSYRFTNATGIGPGYQSNGIWAALDMIDSAIYRATQSPTLMADGKIDPSDILLMLYGAQVGWW